jgi:predicted RNA-binding protein with PUA-like domain
LDAASRPDAPRWYCVDVRLKKKLGRVITLDELRAHATRELVDMLLLRRGNRLSITPVSAAHWRFIRSLE